MKWRTTSAAKSGSSAASTGSVAESPHWLAADQIESPDASAGNPLGGRVSCVAFKLAKRLLNRRPFEQLTELRVMIEQPVTNGGELIFLRHVGAGSDDHFFGGDVKVVAGAGGLVETGMRPPGGDVVFVWTFVGSKTCIPIDAKEGFLRRSDVLRGKVQHGVRDLANDRQHRLFDFRLVSRLVRVEPFARLNGIGLVGADEGAEESDTLFAEIWDDG